MLNMRYTVFLILSVLTDFGVSFERSDVSLKVPLPKEDPKLELHGAAGMSGAAETTERRTTVTRHSWFDRIMSSFVTSVVGFVMFFFTFAFLMANEGNYVSRLRVIDVVKKRLDSMNFDSAGRGGGGGTHVGGCTTQEMHSGVECRPAPTAPPLPDQFPAYQPQHGKNQPELHYTSGLIYGVPVADPLFGIETQALRLHRRVEMYQYHEEKTEKTEKDTIGGGTTTTTEHRLQQGWYETRQTLSGQAEGTPIGGNPQFPVVSGQSVRTRNFNGAVALNGCTLAGSHVDALQAWESLTSVQPNFDHPHSAYLHEQCSAYITTTSGAPYSYGTLEQPGAVATGPRIGDVRVTWTVIPPGHYTLLCGRDGVQLTEYVVDEVPAYRLPLCCFPCACCGLGLCLINIATSSSNVVSNVVRGEHSPKSMIEFMNSSTNGWVWAMRFAGWLMFWVSLMMLLEPLPTLLDIVGFVGSVARFGVAFVSFAVASMLTPLTIAVCWVSYRPLVAFAIAAPSVLLYMYM